MARKIEFAPEAARELARLDKPVIRRILKFLHERSCRLDDPRSVGSALKGAKFGELWKYRVGDYRIISRIEDKRLLILVLRAGHRREVYR
jgi:mRNA interferase RelE/StbE